MALDCTFEGRPQQCCMVRKKAEWNCDCALLHDLMVVYRVPDVDVGLKGDIRYGGVEVEDIRRSRWYS